MSDKDPGDLKLTADDSFENNNQSQSVLDSKRKSLALKEPVDFLKDDPDTMTMSRRFVLNSLINKKWYNPHANSSDSSNSNETESTSIPSLREAWAYFEHLTLPRYLVPQEGDESDGSKFDIAVPGEIYYKTRLYNPFTADPSQMADLGIAVGLYFATLRTFAFIMIIAGLMNIPKLFFYAGETYSNSQKGMSWFLKGSAACNVHEFVPCAGDCLEGSPLGRGEEYRYQTIANQLGENVTFVLRNSCDGAIFRIGIANFITIVFVTLAMIGLAWYLHKLQTDFDVDEQTAQDYSITISNPPPDARDPKEWKEFFETKFSDCDGGVHVTFCTIGVNNDAFLNLVVKRRELLRSIKYAIPHEFENKEDTDMTLDELASIVEKIKKERGFFKMLMDKVLGGIPSMYKALLKLNEEIKSAAQSNSDGFPVSNVFVMFETEAAQRHVLKNIMVSPYNAMKNNVKALKDENYLFRGKTVLKVAEAEEPSTIRWHELNVTTMDFVIKVLMTAVVFGIIVGVGFIVKFLNDRSTTMGTMTITITNVAFPVIAKLITKVERHPREEELQVWLYFKIAFFRWVNTAVVITYITPFTATVRPDEEGVIQIIYQLFLAEVITVNVLQYLDIGSSFKKHLLAPRAPTQEQMNLRFTGTEIMMAERYTNMTKIVFLAMWYAPLFPAGLFFGAIALVVNYYVDRFSFMRSWKPQPKIGPAISRFTRVFAFPLIIAVMTFVASWSWGGFRYDNLCETEVSVPSQYHGTYELTPNKIISTVNTSIFVDDSTKYYEFCPKNEWISSADQKRLVRIFGSFSIAVLVFVIAVMLIPMSELMRMYFTVDYKSVGEDQKIPFRDVLSISSYIPEIRSYKFAYPLLACNIDGIKNSKLFEWDDPTRDYVYYDISKDVDNLLDSKDSRNLFSRVSYWPFLERN